MLLFAAVVDVVDVDDGRLTAIRQRSSSCLESQ